MLAEQGQLGQQAINKASAQQQEVYNQIIPNYQGAVDTNTKDYADIMGAYKSFLDKSSGPNSAVNQFLSSDKYNQGIEKGSGWGAVDESIGGYGNMARTGGYTPGDIQNIRARSVAPVRSIAENARNEIQRSNAIRGTGYSPNTAAALAKTARENAYAVGDTATNTEAGIAQMVQAGKMAGLAGLSSTGLGARGQDITREANQLSNQLGIRGQDLQALLSGENQSLGALSGMANLYGTTPGLTSTFGNQALNAAGQGIQVAGLQGQFSQQQIDDAMKIGAMTGTPWKKILAMTGAVVATVATGGTAAPLIGAAAKV